MPLLLVVHDHQFGHQHKVTYLSVRLTNSTGRSSKSPGNFPLPSSGILTLCPSRSPMPKLPTLAKTPDKPRGFRVSTGVDSPSAVSFSIIVPFCIVLALPLTDGLVGFGSSLENDFETCNGRGRGRLESPFSLAGLAMNLVDNCCSIVSARCSAFLLDSEDVLIFTRYVASSYQQSAL